MLLVSEVNFCIICPIECQESSEQQGFTHFVGKRWPFIDHRLWYGEKLSGSAPCRDQESCISNVYQMHVHIHLIWSLLNVYTPSWNPMQQFIKAKLPICFVSHTVCIMLLWAFVPASVYMHQSQCHVVCTVDAQSGGEDLGQQEVELFDQLFFTRHF